MSRSLEPGVPIPLEDLLAHAHWLRRLAGSLVADQARADDLVQDTWLATVRRPPRAGASPRPWLERVFRNVARNRRRSERTRAEHEQRAGERRPSPSPDAIAQEVEAQRVLAEAVGRLSEPARTIVVLRYFRGLDSGAIGRELALPAGTVRWKLKAALEELRRELDRRFEGGRKAWSLVLGRVLASAATPAASVSIVWLGAAGAVLVIACAGWWSLRRGALDESEPASIADQQIACQAGETATLERLDSTEGGDGELRRADRAPFDRVVASVRSEPAPDIAGVVLVDGVPPAAPIDLELVLMGTLERRLSTDDVGRFEVFAAGHETSFTLTAPGYLLENETSPFWVAPGLETPCLDLVVRLRKPPAIRGRVVSHAGEPVPNAPGLYELRAEASGWSLVSGRGELDCDAEGRFELSLVDLMSEGMPKLRQGETWEGTVLFEVARVGRGLFELGPAPPADLELGDLVLEPVRVLGFTLRDELGAPLSGAVARLDDHWLAAPSSPTNREGRGELRHVPDRATRVRFSALGYADRVLVVEPGEHPVVWLEPVGVLEVQLEPPANTYGNFPEIVLTARDELFEPVDAPQPETALGSNTIQTELGAWTNADWWKSKDENGFRVAYTFEPDAGGRVLVSPVRAEVSFTLEARDRTGRLLARRELVLAPGERRRLVLPYGQ